MKKFCKILLTLALCVSMSACGSKKSSSEFSEYTKTLPALIFENNAFDVNFLFDKPEDYGIKKKVYTLDFVSLDDYKKNTEKLEEKLDELDDYDYDELNKDQKITYDLLKAQDEDSDLSIEDTYYLTTNYFDTNSGIQAQLPMSLWVYEFKNKKSMDSFLSILNDAPSVFKKYVKLEKTRQDKGYGMSKTYMDTVIKTLHTINTSDQSYILTSANEKIDNIDFLTQKEKDDYKAKITKAFNEKFLPAFVQTEKDLSAIKIKKKGDGELASYKGGKEYYEKLVSRSAGVDTMKEYTAYLKKAKSKIEDRILPLVKNYPELYTMITSGGDEMMNALQNIHYTDLTSSADVIAYLEETISSDKDFPAIDKLDYQMHTFPESMKDTTLAAAAYFLSAFDDTSGKDEQMILNGTFDQSNFTTIAHESFPGHMYQHNYFKTVKHDILRDLLSDSTYSEGWATYIEDKACDYSQDAATCHLNNINTQLTYMYVLELDKKIHYDGISRKEAYQYMKENFGIKNEEDLKAQYEQLLENPGVFANYYVGYYKLLDLKDAAKKKWGDKYTDYRFNKLILDLGPLPMDLLEKYAKLL